MESLIGEKKRAFCSNCKGDRNCEIKGHHRVYEDLGHYDWWKNWYLLVCCGCDHVFAQSVSADSNSHYPVGYDQKGNIEYETDETIHYWPARFKRERPVWLEQLHSLIAHERSMDFHFCLLQTYDALDNDLNILAAIGIRTSFDVASEILGIDTELSFERKLKAMEEKLLITTTQKDELEILLNAGNASAHRGWVPSFDDLDALMVTIEHFISDKFVTPELRKKASAAVADLGKRVPKRKPRTLKEKKQNSQGHARAND